MKELSEEEKNKILATQKSIEERAVLNFNRKLLMCDTMEDMYSTLTLLTYILKKQAVEYTLMFPQEYADGQPLSNEARHIATICCTYEEAITECEATALKFEDRVNLYMGKTLIGSSNGNGFINYLENRGE